jgi:hypothetical protein
MGHILTQMFDLGTSLRSDFVRRVGALLARRNVPDLPLAPRSATSSRPALRAPAFALR